MGFSELLVTQYLFIFLFHYVNIPSYICLRIKELIASFMRYIWRLLLRERILFTPRYRVVLEKLTVLQLVKKFPAFHGIRKFITALTNIRHLSLSWASPIQSIYPHPTSWRSILIISTHLRLGLPSGLFPSGFPTKTLYTPSPHPYCTAEYENSCTPVYWMC